MELILAIPYSIPILGEAYSSLNNPVLLAALDFFTRVRLTAKPSGSPKVPITLPSLRRTLTRALSEAGVTDDLQISSQVLDPRENDFLVAASVIYAYALNESPATLAPSLSVADDRSFLTLSRAMNALAGGFTVVRRGEGAVSLDGGLDASFHLSLCRGGSKVGAALESFSDRFPELAPPTWHLVGHLVLEGGRMVRCRDPEGLGRLMRLEAGLSHALGLLDAGELKPQDPTLRCHGYKPIRSEIMKGELILAPLETLPLPLFNRFNPTQEGINEVG